MPRGWGDGGPRNQHIVCWRKSFARSCVLFKLCKERENCQWATQTNAIVSVILECKSEDQRERKKKKQCLLPDIQLVLENEAKVSNFFGEVWLCCHNSLETNSLSFTVSKCIHLSSSPTDVDVARLSQDFCENAKKAGQIIQLRPYLTPPSFE